MSKHQATAAERESVDEGPNPLGLDGIEFIEYATSKPQALGQVLERMGFRPVSRHRSREVLLYRRGDINVIVNAHSGGSALTEQPVINAVALRDFEGLSGHLHDYKVDIAKSMLEMCHALDCRILLACSSTSVHATGDSDALARDLRKLAMLAIPMNIKVAYEALSWGRTINEFPQAWDIIEKADMPNLGLGFDAFHMFATKTPLDDLELVDPDKIFLVQLADFMWNEIKSVEERITTARHFRVFPGEGVHSQDLADLTLKLHGLGYRGDYSFEVFIDDYQQLPLATVAQRARRSAMWLGESVLRRSVPLPNRIRLKYRVRS